MTFYPLGVPKTVIVDDYLPLDKNLNAVFARPGKDGSIWPLILEKGFSKLLGNYGHIDGGAPYIGIQYMRGSPYVKYTHKDETADSVWNLLQQHFKDEDLVTCATPGGDDTDTDADGLV